ncbi:MAG: hypothetical protein AAB575_04410 [Patescibacteria group bacterium]
MDTYEPTKDEIEKWRELNPRDSFSMMDSQVVERLRKERGLPGAAAEQGIGKAIGNAESDDKDDDDDIEGFKIPIRSKRGPVWEKSEDNPHKTVAPDQGFLLAEVDLTPPEEAVNMLAKLFPRLNTNNWEQALKAGLAPAVRACRTLEIDEERLIVFPWIKRKSLARLSKLKEETHYGALVKKVVFPRLARLYKERNLGFTNYRARKMSADGYLRMGERTADWVSRSEESVEEGDICFSAVILDLFHGYSVKATRYETEREQSLINGTCYVLQQLLLTQIQLQTKWEELHWWMPGDKYDPNGQARFPSSLYCFVFGNDFWFDNSYIANSNTPCGSAVFPSELL